MEGLGSAIRPSLPPNRKNGSKSTEISKEASEKRLDLVARVDYHAQDLRKVTRHSREDWPSPKGVLDNGFRWLPESSPSNAGVSSNSSSHWSLLSRLFWSKSIRHLFTFPAVSVQKPWRKNSRDVYVQTPNDTTFHTCSWRSFSLSKLKAATNNFNPDMVRDYFPNKVYRGCLEDGHLIAVKRLTHGTTKVQTNNFLSELGILVHINHPNIAKLIGYCIEGGLHIVLQLSPHGSLSYCLHDSDEKLRWSTRFKIAVGTAQALEYLHEKCQRRIIHRDIKAANILLSEKFEAQICDFGFAKWLPDKWTHHSFSSYEGTFGYLAPECIMHGIVNEKTDIFAFGVVLLELISGGRALDSTMKSLVIWARPLLQMNDFQKLIDPSLGGAYDNAQLNLMVLAASLCLQESAPLRPKISKVLKILRAEDEDLRLAASLKGKILQAHRWGLNSHEQLGEGKRKKEQFYKELPSL